MDLLPPLPPLLLLLLPLLADEEAEDAEDAGLVPAAADADAADVPWLNPRHRPGTYCDVVMHDSTSACAAKATSLSCTVGVSPLYRRAYWARIVDDQ